MNDGPLSLLLVDDRKLSRVGLRAILESDPDIKVVGEPVDHEQTLTLTEDLQPLVVLIDSLSHAIEAPTLTAALVRTQRAPHVLVLVNAMDESAWDILRAGARGVVLKQSEPEQLVAAVQLVAANYTVFAQPGMDIDAEPTPPRWPAAVPANLHRWRLTDRERDVLRLVAKAYSNAEISRSLGVQESTVKSHMRSILDKLGLENRVHAAIYAFQAGLADLDTNPVFARPYWDSIAD